MVFIFSGEKNIVRLLIRDNTMEEPRLEACFMFLIPEGEGTTLWEGLLGWRILARYWEHNRER